MTQKAIRVMIVDDHAIVRKGIRALLATERDIEVLGEASDGAEAIAQAQALRPDVILMDLVMPKIDGIEATRPDHGEPAQRARFGADQLLLPTTRSFQPSRQARWAIFSKTPGRMIWWQAIHQVHQDSPPWSLRSRAKY